MKKVELLAPVGSMESLYAAVGNGADAVYLGGKLFNARQYASNFDEAELEEAIEYAHKRGVKAYLTLNIAIKNDELPELKEYLEFLSKINIDALIVQDLGVINLIKREFPNLKLHASTQMTINNKLGVEFLKKQGIDRVVLARELSIKEIESIRKETDSELEVFVHGALCVSYSGQCLMSSMIGGRSGNRGRCAQTCRMPFKLVDDKDGKAISLEGNYILSPKDLNSIDNVGKLIDIGVNSFKIEGRMKKPEYVALIVNKYRKAIDNHLNQREDGIDNKDREDMRKIFNRGFTEGFLGEDFGKDYISIDKPNNRGTYVGQVIEVKKTKAKIRLEAPLMRGDGLSSDNPDGTEDYYNVDKIFVNRKDSEIGKKNQIVEIKTYRPIKEAAKLYKTFDKELDDRIKENYMEEKDIIRKPVNFKVIFKTNELPKLIASVEFDKKESKNIEALVIGEQKVEEAKKTGVSEKKIEGQLSKLNDTEFKLGSIEYDIDDNIFIPVSVINSLRRDILQNLSDMINNQNEVIESELKEIKDNSTKKSNNKSEQRKSIPKLSIKLNSMKQVKLVDYDKVDRIYVSVRNTSEKEDIKEYSGEILQNIDYIRDSSDKIEIYLSLPKVVGDFEFSNIADIIKLVKDKINGVSVSNIGIMKFINDEFSELDIHSDSSFNVYNYEAVKFLEDRNINSITISPELNLNEMNDLSLKYGFEYEVLVYGYQELMIMKNCPMALIKKCGKDRDCISCNLKDRYSLKDRKDFQFKVLRTGDITTIYNSKVLFVPELIKKMIESGIEYYRLDFNRDDEDIKSIQNLYYKAVNNKLIDDEIEEYIKENNIETNITRGHFNREVL